VRAKVNSILGDRKAAISDFRMQLKFDHRNTEAQLRLSKELNTDRQYSVALTFLNAAIDTLTAHAKPRDTDKFAKFYIERGITKGNLADTAGARVDFKKAVTIDKKMVSAAYANLGNEMGHYKKYSEDSTYLERAIMKDQNNDDAYFYRANLKMIRKNYLGADYDYISVLLINPDNLKTYGYRGLAESYLMDTSNMRLDFIRAMKMSPKSSDNYVLRARAKTNLKDFDGAMKDLDKAVELDPDNSEALYYRGIARLDKNNNDGCADLKRALDLGYKDAADVIKMRCH
jgi:tetratricopeptide (TPR) repeat protein